MERTYAEQNAEHYHLIRTNPDYRLDGMRSVLYEEIMMAMPYLKEPQLEKAKEPEQLPRQDAFHQLQAEVTGWRQKHAEALVAIDQLSKKVKLYEGGDLT